METDSLRDEGIAGTEGRGSSDATDAADDATHATDNVAHAPADLIHTPDDSKRAAGNASHTPGNSTDTAEDATNTSGKETNAPDGGASAFGSASHTPEDGTIVLSDATHASGDETSAPSDATHAPDEKRTRTLFIDADACPTTRDAIACARTANIPCVIAGDSGHNLLRHVRPGDPSEPRDGFWVRTLQVPQGQDAADFAIVCELEPGDVVVTQDFGLASMALGRGSAALDPRGHVYDKRTIDALLLVRHAQKQARRDQRRGKRPKDHHPAFSEDDRKRFVRALRELLQG